MDKSMINDTNQMYAGNTGTKVTVETVRKDAVAQNVVAPYGTTQNTAQTPSDYIIGQQGLVMEKQDATKWKEEFDKYDMTNVDEYNKPDFENDSITVLKAKLENFERIGVPKKEKGE